MSMTTARQIADYFLSKSRPEVGDTITHLKLQKLCYYAQGFHLALYDTPFFNEEIQAWDHGPVVVDLYKEFKKYNADPIPPVNPEKAASGLDERDRKLLDDVWLEYGQFSAWKLRALSHSEPPWKDAYPNGVITNEAMKEFFKTQVTV